MALASSPELTQGACRDCQGEEGGMLVGWGKGMGPAVLPPEAGIPVLGPGGYHSASFQTHYNNPQRVRGVRDSSGMRFHHALQQRAHDMGVLQFGDPHLRLFGRLLPAGWSKHSFRCRGFTEEFSAEDVVVTQSLLHMHATGQRIEARVVRGGAVVRRDSAEVWDWSQNANYIPLSTGRGWMLRRGDELEVDCYYHVPPEREGATYFGRAAHAEMCMDYLMYWPRQPGLRFGGSCRVLAHADDAPGRYLGATRLRGWQDTGRKFGLACDGSNQVPPTRTDSTLLRRVAVVAGAAVMGAVATLLVRRHLQQERETETAAGDEGVGLVKGDKETENREAHRDV